ncbi:RBP1A protein, partial [Thryothorus ludovicianus]|nr:RBP1A protein [Thryothorus ludovicianus]
EQCQVEHSGSLAYTSSSEEISPTKFPGSNYTIELPPTPDCLYEPPDIVSDDEKVNKKKKGKLKKKEK